MEILELIDRIEDLVEESSSLPFSKKSYGRFWSFIFHIKEMRETFRRD